MDDELFTTEMAYDPAGRVTTIHHHHDVSGTPIRTFAYAYDLAGNRTSAALNGTPTSYTYNTRNQLTSDGTHTFGYDKNGNRISDGTLSTVWDRAGRMLSHDGHSYAYDGEGRRIAQTASGSTTRYVLDVQRGLPAVIGAKAGSDVTHYMHGPLGMFAQRNPDASWDWMLHDGMGSVRGVFDGTLHSAAEYDPFGEPIVAPIGTAYGFTGELTDGNGLVYLRARYLAPGLGTFASRDPWRGSASAPRTWNGYAWVEGNVVNRVDPGGMAAGIAACESTATSIADILQALQPTQVPTPTSPASTCAGAAYFLDPRCSAPEAPETIYLGGSRRDSDPARPDIPPIYLETSEEFARAQAPVWAELADIVVPYPGVPEQSQRGDRVGKQLHASNALSEVPTTSEYVLIGYSAGADSALILADLVLAQANSDRATRFAGIAVLGPTFDGGTSGHLGTENLRTEVDGIPMWQGILTRTLSNGTRVLVLDDEFEVPSAKPDWASFQTSNQNFCYVRRTDRLHYRTPGFAELGTNNDADLAAEVAAFLNGSGPCPQSR